MARSSTLLCDFRPRQGPDLALQRGESGADAAPLRRPRVQLCVQGDARQQHGLCRGLSEGQAVVFFVVVVEHLPVRPRPLPQPGVQHKARVGTGDGAGLERTGGICDGSIYLSLHFRV